MAAAPVGAGGDAGSDDDGGTTGGAGTVTSGVTIGGGTVASDPTIGTWTGTGATTISANTTGTATITANTTGAATITDSTTLSATSYPGTTLDDIATGRADAVGTGAQELCYSSCDCPQFTRCLSGLCEPTTRVTFCCLDELCPAGETCETPEGTVGVCGYPDGY